MSDSDENVREIRRKPRLKRTTAFEFSVETSNTEPKKSKKQKRVKKTKSKQTESSESESPIRKRNSVRSQSVFNPRGIADDVAGFSPISPPKKRNTYELNSTVHELDLLKSVANSPMPDQSCIVIADDTPESSCLLLETPNGSDDEAKFVTASENEETNSSKHKSKPSHSSKHKNHEVSPTNHHQNLLRNVLHAIKNKKLPKLTSNEETGEESNIPTEVCDSPRKTRRNKRKETTLINETDVDDKEAEPVAPKKKRGRKKKERKASSNGSEDLNEGEESALLKHSFDSTKKKKGRPKKAEPKLTTTESETEFTSKESSEDKGEESIVIKQEGTRLESGGEKWEESIVIKQSDSSKKKKKRRTKKKATNESEESIVDSCEEEANLQVRRSKKELRIVTSNLDEGEESKLQDAVSKKQKLRSKWEEPNEEHSNSLPETVDSKKKRRTKIVLTNHDEGEESTLESAVSDSPKKPNRRSKWEERTIEIFATASDLENGEESDSKEVFDDGGEESQVLDSAKKSRGKLKREEKLDETRARARREMFGSATKRRQSVRLSSLMRALHKKETRRAEPNASEHENEEESSLEVVDGMEEEELGVEEKGAEPKTSFVKEEESDVKNKTWTVSMEEDVGWEEPKVSFNGKELSVNGEESIVIEVQDESNVSTEELKRSNVTFGFKDSVSSDKPMLSFGAYCKTLEAANSSFLSPAHKRKSTRKTWQKSEGTGTPLKLDFGTTVNLLEASPPWNKENDFVPTPKSKKKPRKVSDTRIPKRTKMPDFNKIRDKALNKMENVAEHLEKKNLRAQLLMSGNKVPIGIATRQATNPNTKKQLQFTSGLKTPKKITKTPTETKPNISKLKTPKKITNPTFSSTQHLGVRTPKNPFSAIFNAPEGRNVSKLKTPKKFTSDNPFSVGKVEAVAKVPWVSKLEVAKNLVLKKKAERDRAQESRNTLKGVRLNRRFELMMNMREGKKT